MKDEQTQDSPETEAIENLTDVPVQMVNTYARLWQFETWLRALVYVELRALRGDDWANGLEIKPGHLRADKSLIHMPTVEINALSFAQLPQLLALIEANWSCFSAYFPPKKLWDAKLEEVKQIRHRVAHFRVGHEDDLARLKQFLRDIDKGFWRFCTSYNALNPVIPQTCDPIAAHFLPLDPLPWSEIEQGKWAQVGVRDKSLPVGLSVRSQRRVWCRDSLLPGNAGHLYDFYLFAQDARCFDLEQLLNQTNADHHHLVHICLDHDESSVRLTVPSILGEPSIIALVERFHEAALYAARRGRNPIAPPPNVLAERWPEYVIGPRNPLTFLDPQMPCSFFGV